MENVKNFLEKLEKFSEGFERKDVTLDEIRYNRISEKNSYGELPDEEVYIKQEKDLIERLRQEDENMIYFETETSQALKKPNYYVPKMEFHKGIVDDDFKREDSLYIDVFRFKALGLENVFRQMEKDFSFFAITRIYKDEWGKMVVARDKYDKETQEVIMELDKWAQECFKEHKCFSVIC